MAVITYVELRSAEMGLSRKVKPVMTEIAYQVMAVTASVNLRLAVMAPYRATSVRSVMMAGLSQAMAVMSIVN